MVERNGPDGQGRDKTAQMFLRKREHALSEYAFAFSFFVPIG